jgi:hypothetical protein
LISLPEQKRKKDSFYSACKYIFIIFSTYYGNIPYYLPY